MEQRAFFIAAFICVCGALSLTEARWTVRPVGTAITAASTTPLPRRTTTTTTKRTTTTRRTTTAKPPNAIIDNLTAAHDADRNYHPAEVQKPRLIERYDQRYMDGHYEYRYVLSNGDTRYERSYWVQVGKKKALAKKGYYSYPLPNRKYLTVYYTADQNGYRQDSSTYSSAQPLLPRNLAVPEEEVGSSITTERTTKKRSPTKVPETRQSNDKPNQTVDLGVVSQAAATPTEDTQTTTTAAAAAAEGAAEAVAVMTQNKDQQKEVKVETVKAEAVDGDKVQDSVVDIQAAVTQGTFTVVGAEDAAEGKGAAGTATEH